jgi:hypothetical protein
VPAYEYLTVNTVTKTNWAEISALPDAIRPAATFTQYAFIWRPGASKPEEREVGVGGVVGLFNELGTQGWRLVERTITATTVHDYSAPDGGDFFGHKREIGAPLMERATFMRELSQ